ncbi:hypothetical protein TRFO_09262 [Tritrichomonas foetus]|uniref:non-specific serine/threonine protein kinase n=1 Tax=Tritrichomonas foetus TaxID=1144522 RepID=A0A1J4JF55_9EUKA|nr:hypothetical protein TRFO_09262 [Tritrichomonas foetus]|eukprot:OHS97830.1 hypothetical protein TRFO_09262 [Tritrichomonas foetus]
MKTYSFNEKTDPSEFRKVRDIGIGGFGLVIELEHIPSEIRLAGKMINNESLLSDSAKETLLKENKLMSQINTPFAVRYYGTIRFEGKLTILMDFCDRGSLRDIMDYHDIKLTESQIAFVMHDLLLCLKILHKKLNIMHRDIKAANILANSKGQFKLTDFGVSRQFAADANTFSTVSTIGTPYWMAPEVAITQQKYSFPCDIWSVGTTAIELAEGGPPYCEYEPMRAMKEIATHGFPGFRQGNDFSKEFRDFVEKCMVMDPKQRATIDDLLALPFIQNLHQYDRQNILNDLIAEEIDFSELLPCGDEEEEEEEAEDDDENGLSNVETSSEDLFGIPAFNQQNNRFPRESIPKPKFITDAKNENEKPKEKEEEEYEYEEEDGTIPFPNLLGNHSENVNEGDEEDPQKGGRRGTCVKVRVPLEEILNAEEETPNKDVDVQESKSFEITSIESNQPPINKILDKQSQNNENTNKANKKVTIINNDQANFFVSAPKHIKKSARFNRKKLQFTHKKESYRTFIKPSNEPVEKLYDLIRNNKEEDPSRILDYDKKSKVPFSPKFLPFMKPRFEPKPENNNNSPTSKNKENNSNLSKFRQKLEMFEKNKLAAKEKLKQKHEIQAKLEIVEKRKLLEKQKLSEKEKIKDKLEIVERAKLVKKQQLIENQKSPQRINEVSPKKVVSPPKVDIQKLEQQKKAEELRLKKQKANLEYITDQNSKVKLNLSKNEFTEEVAKVDKIEYTNPNQLKKQNLFKHIEYLILAIIFSILLSIGFGKTKGVFVILLVLPIYFLMNSTL